ncbi:hypothetical protein EXIGLDRAFT_717343 [Exidia glandulosa HHB12029]|uniref:F-box domain-containing protein n=1 Tax=Exidia glandulosa HHB12029 TaxID=1314781 RepID=A0A166AMA2_EXIGL|nr:hypothetical protein EXIGLDRAFT_717343 [Exidia glandulosa HHB12029]
MRRGPELIADVVLLVFELGKPAPAPGAAPDLDELRVYNASLLTYALVCKDWAACAQELLFRHVLLHGGHSSKSSFDAVDSLIAAPKRLRDKTRTMAVRVGKVIKPGEVGKPPVIVSKHLSWTAFAELVAAFPKLTSLAVHIHSLDLLQPELEEEELQRLSSCLSIQRLAVRTHMPVRTSVMCQLVSPWPRLLSLEVASRYELPFEDPLEVDTERLAAFECLCDLQVFMASESPTRWLGRIAPFLRCVTSLRCAWGDLAGILPSVNTTLQALTVDGDDDQDMSLARRELAKCASLRFATFTSCFITDDFAHIPLSVHHLAAFVDPSTLPHLLETHTALKTLDVIYERPPVWGMPSLSSRKDTKKESAIVEALCAKRHIRLRVLSSDQPLAERIPVPDLDY